MHSSEMKVSGGVRNRQAIYCMSCPTPFLHILARPVSEISQRFQKFHSIMFEKAP
jgi:hypothetical protein